MEGLTRLAALKGCQPAGPSVVLRRKKSLMCLLQDFAIEFFRKMILYAVENKPLYMLFKNFSFDWIIHATFI